MYQSLVNLGVGMASEAAEKLKKQLMPVFIRTGFVSEEAKKSGDKFTFEFGYTFHRAMLYLFAEYQYTELGAIINISDPENKTICGIPFNRNKIIPKNCFAIVLNGEMALEWLYLDKDFNISREKP